MLHLRRDSLPITCAYLAAQDEIKKRNTHFSVTDINATYTVENSIINSSEKRYPFSIEYVVSGIAKSPFSKVYYHLIAKNTQQPLHKVEYCFDQDDWSRADHAEYQSDNITVFSFARKNRYQKGELIKYRIRITFDAGEGIAVEKTQRIIFSTQNFSSQFSKNARFNIKLIVPSTFERDFKEPRITRYSDGLNSSETDDIYSFESKSSDTGNCEFVNALDIMANELYCIEFTESI